MVSSTPMTEVGGNVWLDTGVHLDTVRMEEEDDIEATPKELFDLIDRHERRSQSNIKSSLEANRDIENEPKVMFVGTKLNQNLKNKLITFLNEFKYVFAWSQKDMPDLTLTLWSTSTIMVSMQARKK